MNIANDSQKNKCERMFTNMKEIMCKALTPCERIEVGIDPICPIGHYRFVVHDDEIENRVDEAYDECVVHMYTENGTITSDVKIACYDDSGKRFATVWIDENRQKWVLFDDPDSEFIPCSRSSIRALTGNSTWVRMIFKSPSFDICVVDIVGRFYLDEYVRVWGLF